MPLSLSQIPSFTPWVIESGGRLDGAAFSFVGRLSYYPCGSHSSRAAFATYTVQYTRALTDEGWVTGALIPACPSSRDALGCVPLRFALPINCAGAP